MTTEVEAYQDPIITLANDPNLNKEIDKTNLLVEYISKFSLAERKISKLCQLSLTILQTLEKMELNLKNWAFLSLDINSNDHFENENSDIKQFNNSISMRVLTDCNLLNKKLSKISVDMDYITKALRTLTPIEYILDSGTLLTSLTLRNIKLKHELTDRVTVSYLKAKLITIGTELEEMLEDESMSSTVSTYKSFVVNLLQQLNNAIDDEDMTEKHECLAVINDMEKMFDAFKLERVQQMAKESDSEDELDAHKPHGYLEPPPAHDTPKYYKSSSPKMYSSHSEDDNESLDDSEIGSSMYGSMYNPPIIHSITKSNHSDTSSYKPSRLSESYTSDSFGMGNSMLHKTTISEEMPYLMSAFSLAKNVEEDIKNFKQEEEDEPPKQLSKKKHNKETAGQAPGHSESSKFRYAPMKRSNISETPLTSQSQILQEHTPSPYSYLFGNKSFLSKVGIKPQVITTDLPSNVNYKRQQKELGPNTTTNINNSHTKTLASSSNYERAEKPNSDILADEDLETDDENDTGDKYDKENSMIKPLTQRNLVNHTFSSLSVSNEFNDQVE